MQGDGRPAAGDIATTVGLCEMTLQTRDIDALARFYREVFGLAELAREHDRIWLACGPRSRLGLWSPGRKEFGDRGGAHVHFALALTCDGLQALAARLREKGIAFRGPVEHDGGDRSVYLEDPEGNVVEAWSFFADGPGARGGVAALT